MHVDEAMRREASRCDAVRHGGALSQQAIHAHTATGSVVGVEEEGAAVRPTKNCTSRRCFTSSVRAIGSNLTGYGTATAQSCPRHHRLKAVSTPHLDTAHFTTTYRILHHQHRTTPPVPPPAHRPTHNHLPALYTPHTLTTTAFRTLQPPHQ
uniref:Uncharacterized protein n=1 Tax=Echinococcus granulosus TaxID=6210 RepID=A0A068WTD9_ECHGR|nr:hypothetical protein EgrG_000037700 [Echinococcus granulosus]